MILSEPLVDESVAVGLFNLAEEPCKRTLSCNQLGLKDRQPVRYLWRQADVGWLTASFSAHVASPGVVLLPIWPES